MILNMISEECYMSYILSRVIVIFVKLIFHQMNQYTMVSKLG